MEAKDKAIDWRKALPRKKKKKSKKLFAKIADNDYLKNHCGIK